MTSPGTAALSLVLTGCFISGHSVHQGQDLGPASETRRVRGTANGLEGDVRLRLNDVETLVVESDGVFAFATELHSGAEYSVIIAAQSPAQACSLANAGGLVADTDVTVDLDCCSPQCNGNCPGLPNVVCGGSCSKTCLFTDPPTCGSGLPSTCIDGVVCDGDADCASDYCLLLACAQPTSVAYSDGRKNAQETDTDCGGQRNPHRCVLGKSCREDQDCLLRACVGEVCVVPRSDDLVRNGNEVDVDCGGASIAEGDTTYLAPRCQLTRTCVEGSDCASAVCGTAKKCVANACALSTCPPAVSIGEVSGDSAAEVVTDASAQPAWRSVKITEDDLGPSGQDLRAKIELASSSMQFDLFVYDGCGGNVVSAATGPTNLQVVSLDFGEGAFGNGIDDTKTFALEVRARQTTCEQLSGWELTVKGNR